MMREAQLTLSIFGSRLVKCPMFSSNPQRPDTNRFANVSVNFTQQQPQQQQNQQNTHSQQYPSTSQQQQQMLFQQGTSIQNSATQREPEWFNNPRKRTIPQAIVKRTTKRSFSVDSSTTDGDGTSRTGRSGFNSIGFGSKKDVGLLPSSKDINVIKKSDHNNGFMDSNEAPPTVSFYDWKREDDFGSINPLDLQTNDSQYVFKSKQTELASTPSTTKKNKTEGSETNVFDRKSSVGLNNKQNNNNLETKTGGLRKSATQESAVIVFGYPESISNLVITHFSKFGRILEDFEVLRSNSGINTATLKLRGNKSDKQERKCPIFTGDGWVKLTYDSVPPAVRALQENGRVFGGTLIGCVPYSKSAVEQLASCHIEKVDDIGAMNSPTPIDDANTFKGLSKDIEAGADDKHTDSVSGVFNTSSGKLFDSGSDDVLSHRKVVYPSRRLDIKEGKSLFVHNGATNNHNFLQSLEAKMRQQEENNKKEAGIWHKVNNWLFGWNEL